MIETIEWIGCITGLCGASLLSLNNRYSGWGFVLFLLSNVAWIVFGLMSHATGMVVMQIGFTATSLMGVWRWLITPRVALKSTHKNGG
jgi:nicotinamide riboside transporter PnuC